MIESLNSASSRAGFVYSQLHMSAEHDHEHERTGHKTSRLQPPHKGLRFATESPWTLWHTGGSRQGHPRHTGASEEEGCGWSDTSSTRRPTTNDNTTDKVLRQMCFQETSADRHLQTYTMCDGCASPPRLFAAWRVEASSFSAALFFLLASPCCSLFFRRQPLHEHVCRCCESNPVQPSVRHRDLFSSDRQLAWNVSMKPRQDQGDG